MTLEVVPYLDCTRRQLDTVILALTKVWQSGVKRNLDSPSQYAKTLNMADSWYIQPGVGREWLGEAPWCEPWTVCLATAPTHATVETEGTSCTYNHTETVQLQKVV